ncbi:acyl-CoA dehydrogenase family protein [Amycolatopsis alba]|uniref:Acyl-CoA dehydrogenase n=1 Tax=Amycolatopsis alba DSM 44262 TaxID=1125972 RepID=A0A229R7Z7_AMYAL|nr:acyl-CoA dehydrogenase family protein [Amycolatopsis alba]OXM42609.1 acyl-CoA dehydrogenase [Amycolatopsis alba DSM 44262]
MTTNLGGHEDFRATVRSTLDKIVTPNASKWEAQGHISESGWRELGDAGLLALPHTGVDFLRSAVFLDELGNTGYAGIRASVGVHAYMASSYVRLFGNAEQKARLLPPGERGDKIAALAITEPEAGTDLRNLTTSADADGSGGYRLRGRKSFVANGSQAGYFIVLARTKATGTAGGMPGASLLIVDADADGITRRPQPMLGWRAADITEVQFDDVPVAAGQLIGKPERALLYLVRALDFERLVAGLLAVGGVRYCLRLLKEFARSHRVGDTPLGSYQAVRHRIADLDAQLELVHGYAYQAATRQSLGKLDTKSASVLKLTATELAVTAAQACVQYHGARGYLDDATAARLYRDAMAGTIAAGTNELLRDHIFESI